jgi:ribonuclease J
MIMRLCIHRGSKQIGGSCVEVESCGQRLIIDFGLPLDAEKNGEQYLPDIPGLDGSNPSLLGILISHPHLDHYGLLAHVSPKLPVGMGRAARRILEAAAPFMPGNRPAPAKGPDYQSGQRFVMGPFHITPFLVDHSAYDSYALLIEADGKRVFYSGDFRAHGRKGALFERLLSNPPQNIDLLLLEGSSIGRIDNDRQVASESDVEEQLVQAFSETEGLAMVHTSSQNIDRIVSIMRASKRTGRTLVMDLYTAAIMEATGNPAIPQSDWNGVALYVPQPQRIQIKNNKWFDLLNRHKINRIFPEHLPKNPGNKTLLFRPLHMRDLEQEQCLSGSAYIYSQWEGYWERGSYTEVKNWLEQHGISKTSIHTSGHASPADLKRFAEALAPRKIVPIHSFMPERYPDLFQNVEMYNDEEWRTV